MFEGFLTLAGAALAASADEETAVRRLSPLCRLALKLDERGARANLGRLLEFTGQEATEHRLQELLQELAETQARRLIGNIKFHQDPKGYATTIDAPLLKQLAELLQQGRGVVLVCPNLGNTSALLTLPWHGVRLTGMFVVAPPSYPAGGGGAGLTSLSVGTGASELLKSLGRGEAVLLPGDLDYFPDARSLPFCGAPFFPPHGPVRLAQAAGAPLLPVWTVWEQRRHVLRCAEPIPTAGKTQEELEQALLRALEAPVSRHPGQWLFLDDAWDLKAQTRRSRGVLRRRRAFLS